MREFTINRKPQPVERILEGHRKAMAEVKSVMVEMFEEYDRTMQAHETWYRLEVPTSYDGWEKAYYQLRLAHELASICRTMEIITEEHYHWINEACNAVQDMLVRYYYPVNYYNDPAQKALKGVQPVPAEEYDHGDC